MAVNLSPLAGAGWQFFSNDGVPLAGGLLYTYQAGTSTLAATYTTSAGNVANANPIVLTSTGRTPSEVWLDTSLSYKFILQDASANQIGSYDNLSGIATAQEIAQVYADLANTSSLTKGSALVGFKQANSSGFYSAAVGRTVFSKLQEWVSVKDFGAVGDGTTDDTASIQAAINATAAGGSLYFPSGNYKVTTLDTGACYTTWYCDNAYLVAGSTANQDCLLRFQGYSTNIYGLKINMNFKRNYTCALWWYNASLSSQYNNFFGLQIEYGLLGLVFGALPGNSSTNYAQSENSIFGYMTKGMQKSIYVNHSNGFIFLTGSMVAVQDEGWSTGSPGNFNYQDNRAFTCDAGQLVISNSEIQNSVADVTTNGSIVNGGNVFLNQCMTEVDVPFSISGELKITGGRILNTQSLTNQFYIPSSASAASVLKVSDCQIFRPPGTGSFSAKSLVNNTGSSRNIEITFNNCDIQEWAQFVPLLSGNAQSVEFNGCRWYPNGYADPYFATYKLDTVEQSIYDSILAVDTEGITTDGYYLYNEYGAGTTIGLSTDVPSGYYYTNSVYVDATGKAGVFTVDRTSLSTVKSTAIRTKQNDSFLVEGWVKILSGSTASLGCAIFDNTGTLLSDFTNIVDQSQGVTTSWSYLRQVVTMPANACYVGFGVYGIVSKIAIVGMKVRKANWNTY